MKTDNLIQLLVLDQKAPPSLERSIFFALTVGLVISALPFFLLHGPRDDIASAMMMPRFLFKIAEALLLAAVASFLVLRLVRPGAETRSQTIAMFAPLILLVGAVAIELFLVPSSQWLRKLIGDNYYICLTSIFLLSLPLLGAILYALRLGAPVKPGLVGAVAGLLAGGLAASLYAVQCTDDSPLFVATWYTLSITAVSLLGAYAGKRVLQW